MYLTVLKQKKPHPTMGRWSWVGEGLAFPEDKSKAMDRAYVVVDSVLATCKSTHDAVQLMSWENDRRRCPDDVIVPQAVLNAVKAKAKEALRAQEGDPDMPMINGSIWLMEQLTYALLVDWELLRRAEFQPA